MDDNGDLLCFSVMVIIEVMMGIIVVLIFVFCKVKVVDVLKQFIFFVGIVGVIVLFGIVWLVNMFVVVNQMFIVDGLGLVVLGLLVFFGVLLFVLVFFVVVMFIISQLSVMNVIVLIGIMIGFLVMFLVGLWLVMMGIYILLVNGSQVVMVVFDQIGMIRMGKFVVDYFFQLLNFVYIGIVIIVGVMLFFLFG